MCSIGIGSSSKIAVEMVWCSIWKAKVPNKVKMFAWRACHNVLLAFANLIPFNSVTRSSEVGLCPGHVVKKTHKPYS